MREPPGLQRPEILCGVLHSHRPPWEIVSLVSPAPSQEAQTSGLTQEPQKEKGISLGAAPQ